MAMAIEATMAHPLDEIVRPEAMISVAARARALDRLAEALAELDDAVEAVAECRIEQAQGLPCPELGVALAHLECSEATVNAAQDAVDDVWARRARLTSV